MIKTFIALALLALPAALAAQPAPAAEAARPLRKPDVAYEPTPQHKVREMLDLAGVKAGDVVYDLGSGDGRIPITAARDYGARGVGFDLNPKLVERARANAVAANVTDRVSFRNEDLFTANISEATVVTLFLWPTINKKLQPKLLAELKPGTRIVGYWHSMDGWVPDKVLPGGILGGRIFLWTIPPRSAGGRATDQRQQQGTGR